MKDSLDFCGQKHTFEPGDSSDRYLVEKQHVTDPDPSMAYEKLNIVVSEAMRYYIDDNIII